MNDPSELMPTRARERLSQPNTRHWLRATAGRGSVASRDVWLSVFVSQVIPTAPGHPSEESHRKAAGSKSTQQPGGALRLGKEKGIWVEH